MPKIDIAKIPVDTVCMYPEPFWQPIVGRERKRLGNAVGLSQFGVNLVTLKAGAWSSQRHWHRNEDEFVYVLEGEITLNEGRVVQANFNDYRMLRIGEMPSVEVTIVPSAEKPTGVGEPGVPPIGPAVANAWRALTGERVRHLPFARGLAA